MKVALVYDRVNKWGGAERVLLALHKIFPKAPLYTSVYNPKTAPWAKVFNVKTSFLQKFPFASSNHEFYALLMPLAFESFNFDEFDIVISVTSEAAKGIITKPKTLHICYCLTPTRYLWSGYDDYFKNKIFKFLSKPVVSYLRTWDKMASQRPDRYIAISKEVQKRIKKYYGRDSKVIYPPMTFFEDSRLMHVARDTRPAPVTPRSNDYFLVVSRLVPYKRIDIAIEACNKLNLPLKIIGKGKEEGKLRKMAGPKIEFLSDLTDWELSNYYKKADALIFPGIEDFGLSMVEAQSYGKPVIAYKKGSASEIIKEGITGVFFSEHNSKSLIKTLQSFDKKRYNSSYCVRNSGRFSFEVFKRELMDFIRINSD